MIDKIYIIHYTKLTERKERILSSLEKQGVPYEFITEYDQEDLEYVKKNYYNEDKEEYEKKIKTYEKLYGKLPFKPLNDAEISCTIKHILAIKKVSEECSSAGLILEDDAIAYYDNFLFETERSMGCYDNWGCIFLGQGIGDSFIGSKEKENIAENLYRVHHPATNCAEAFVIKKEVAKLVYKTILPFQQISDWEMACNFDMNNIDICWRLPSLFYQGSKSGEYKSTLR